MLRQQFKYGDQNTGRVPGLVLSASASEGLSATFDGEPATLAVIVADGRLIEHDLLGREVMAVCANAYRNFLRGEGALRVLSLPLPFQPTARSKAQRRSERP